MRIFSSLMVAVVVLGTACGLEANEEPAFDLGREQSAIDSCGSVPNGVGPEWAAVYGGSNGPQVDLSDGGVRGALGVVKPGVKPRPVAFAGCVVTSAGVICSDGGN